MVTLWRILAGRGDEQYDMVFGGGTADRIGCSPCLATNKMDRHA